MATKRYSDKELDKLEDQIEVLEKRKQLFLTLGILCLTIGPTLVILAIFGLDSFFENYTFLYGVLGVTNEVSGFMMIPGGIALLILRKVIFSRKIDNINKIIDTEMDLRDEEKLGAK